MNICMMTNTYLPHVGGVARSVSTFAEEFTKKNHRVLVVAPEFEGKPPPRRVERLVERVASLQKFNGSDFSVRLPLAAALSDRLDRFRADIVHAHHPFLLGDTALRIAANKNVPVVFTHHTRYEDYTHYVPFDSPALKDVAINLSTQFANLCDGVIAPSDSIAQLIRERGVTTPIKVVPTGIDVAAFAGGDGARFRRKLKLPEDAFVVGHVGRLAPEKNLEYLASAVAGFLTATPDAWFVVVGSGPSEEVIQRVFAERGVSDRLVLAGKQTGKTLMDAYRSFEVFAFSSFSETQGMVLAEAMAADAPVVALDASGVREVLKHERNGFLLPAEATPEQFQAALGKLHADRGLLETFRGEARSTADAFSKEHCADLALEFYAEVRAATRRERLINEQSPWHLLTERVAVEWNLLANKTQAVVAAFTADRAAEDDDGANTPENRTTHERE